MRSFAVRTFAGSALSIGVLLAIGWYCLLLQWRNPLPYTIQSAVAVLFLGGLELARSLGYMQSEAHPPWWHGAVAVGSASLVCALALTVLLTSVRAIMRVAARLRR